PPGPPERPVGKPVCPATALKKRSRDDHTSTISLLTMATRPRAIAFLACHSLQASCCRLRTAVPMFSALRAIFRLPNTCPLLLLMTISAAPAASAAPVHEKVYLLRGLTNVLSPGIDQLN